MHARMSRTITLQRGQDATFDVTVTDEDGAPVELDTVTLLFQARATVQGVLLFQKQTGQGIAHNPTELGMAALTIDAGDTAGVPPLLRWGLWLVDAAGRRQPLREAGFLEVRDSVVTP